MLQSPADGGSSLSSGSIGRALKTITPWDEFSPGNNRGKKYRNKAVEFGHAFPIGTVLTEENLNEWLIEKMQIDPPREREKGSEGWMAFLTRRHWAVWRLNRGAQHPKMKTEHNIVPFRIVKAGRDKYEVVGMTNSIVKSDTASYIMSLAERRYEEIAVFRKSLPEGGLDPFEREIIDGIMDSYESFSRSVVNKAQETINNLERANRMLGMLQQRLRGPDHES
jgi:hypothetical protein